MRTFSIQIPSFYKLSETICFIISYCFCLVHRNYSDCMTVFKLKMVKVVSLNPRGPCFEIGKSQIPVSNWWHALSGDIFDGIAHGLNVNTIWHNIFSLKKCKGNGSVSREILKSLNFLIILPLNHYRSADPWLPVHPLRPKCNVLIWKCVHFYTSPTFCML